MSYTVVGNEHSVRHCLIIKTLDTTWHIQGLIEEIQIFIEKSLFDFYISNEKSLFTK